MPHLSCANQLAGRHGVRQRQAAADDLVPGLYLISQSKNTVAALELRRHLGVCYRGAWRIKHKLMQTMTRREAGRHVAGVVRVDDAYLGGERTGGRAGRGAQNKRPFLIAVAPDEAGHPRQAVIEPVPAFTRAALDDWATRRLAPSADVYSDGLGAFRAVADLNPAHTVIQAPPGKAGTEVDGARWVNVVLGNLKRSLDGTCHAFGIFKYAERYRAEAAWRSNRPLRPQGPGAATAGHRRRLPSLA